MVEILSEYSTFGPYQKAVEQWVKDNNITIPYEIGNEVDTSHGRGMIVAIRPETAELIVQPVVPDGRTYGKTGGWVIRVENATSPD